MVQWMKNLATGLKAGQVTTHEDQWGSSHSAQVSVNVHWNGNPLGLLVVQETQLPPDRLDVLRGQERMQVLRRTVIPQDEDKSAEDELVVLYRQEARANTGQVGDRAVDAFGEHGADGD